MSSFHILTIFSSASTPPLLVLINLDQTSIFFSYTEGSLGKLSPTYALCKVYRLAIGAMRTRIVYEGSSAQLQGMAIF